MQKINIQKIQNLLKSLYISGIGHRIILPDINDDSPFLIGNLDSKTSFCVYSSSLPHKKLFACTYTMGVNDRTIKGNIYTKDTFYSFNKGITERMTKFFGSLDPEPTNIFKSA